jgi:hypothetical protein
MWVSAKVRAKVSAKVSEGELDVDCIGYSGLGLAKKFSQHVCAVLYSSCSA